MTQLTQTFLLVADLEESRQFYEGLLRLEPERVGESSVTYETGDCELKLQADFEPDVLEEYNLSPPPATGRGAGAILVLKVAEPLRTIHQRLNQTRTESTGKSLIEPRAVPWNGRMFLVEDPDGYVFEIRSNET